MTWRTLQSYCILIVRVNQLEKHRQFRMTRVAVLMHLSTTTLLNLHLIKEYTRIYIVIVILDNM